jgi:hypothetical protein
MNVTEYLRTVQLALSTPAQRPSLHTLPALKDGTDLPQYLFWYGVTLQLPVQITSTDEKNILKWDYIKQKFVTE